MPWSDEGPSSQQLGYGGRVRADMSEAPRPTPSAHPWLRRVVIAVVLALLALVFAAGFASCRQTDRESLAWDSSGTWLQDGALGSTVTIARPPVTGGIARQVFKGRVDGHTVRGVITAPPWPSLSVKLQVDLLGRRWDLRVPRSGRMTLTNASGRVITFIKI